MIRLLLALSLAIAATASPIAPGPVASSFPLWEVPCDGTVQGIAPWGCNAGETRGWLPTGEVEAGYFKPTTVLADPAPLPPAILPPVWIETPVAPEVPVLSATPEPATFGLLVAFIGALIWVGRNRV